MTEITFKTPDKRRRFVVQCEDSKKPVTRYEFVVSATKIDSLRQQLLRLLK